jgi:hypothetical protein
MAAVCAAVASVSLGSSLMAPETTARLDGMAAAEAPPREARFSVAPPGSSVDLPSGRECETMVERSAWEPRADNSGSNHNMPDPQAVLASFAARPRSGFGTYDRRWDTWLLPRVNGQFTGTTDEIIQWAACKWGLNDNMLRAILVRESTWYQQQVYPSGRCVPTWGCGDFFTTEPYQDRIVYCAELARFGRDYQDDYGLGRCPKTFSIAGVMAWSAPAWGFDWPGNQNGTFPFSRDSTAFAVDYLGSELRGCYEGWKLWLHDRPGDMWGCVGAWYSGDWRSPAARAYITNVRASMQERPWLRRDWPAIQPPCDASHGCPGVPWVADSPAGGTTSQATEPTEAGALL